MGKYIRLVELANKIFASQLLIACKTGLAAFVGFDRQSDIWNK
jgi:hypothetical protein